MKQSLFLVGLAAVLLAGCSTGGSIDDKVVGKWKGEMKMPETKKGDPSAAFAKAFAGMLSMDVELKKDKTFAMTTMSIPVEGNWTATGADTLELKPTKVMGMTMDEAKKEAEKKSPGTTMTANSEKPMNLKLSADGKTLTLVTTGKDQGEVVFTKQ
jgi:hypothetical protein